MYIRAIYINSLGVKLGLGGGGGGPTQGKRRK